MSQDMLWERLKKARERIDAAHKKMFEFYGIDQFPPGPPIEVQPTPIWLAYHVSQAEAQAELSEGLTKIMHKFPPEAKTIEGGASYTAEDVRRELRALKCKE